MFCSPLLFGLLVVKEEITPRGDGNYEITPRGDGNYITRYSCISSIQVKEEITPRGDGNR